MTQGEEEIQTARLVVDDLEPYRRLIELQRQMIELVRQHEKTKRECGALREQLSRETVRLLRARPGWRRRMNQVARKWVIKARSSLKMRGAKRPAQSASLLRTTTP